MGERTPQLAALLRMSSPWVVQAIFAKPSHPTNEPMNARFGSLPRFCPLLFPTHKFVSLFLCMVIPVIHSLIPCILITTNLLTLAHLAFISSYIDCQWADQVAERLRGVSRMHELIRNMAF